MNKRTSEHETHTQSDAPIITLLHLSVQDKSESVVPDIYHLLTPELLRQEPELQVSLLAKNLDTQSTEPFLVLSHWQRLDAYQAWESNNNHRARLRPLVQVVNGLRPETFVCVG